VTRRRRTPNPWIAVPVLAAAVLGAVLGWTVTGVNCLPERCTGIAVVVAIISALAAGAGVLVVVVLAYRSIAEWRHGGRSGR
jgi:hypothetical protein